jgi:hypothetical protein
MMAISWYPLQSGQKLSAKLFNELVEAIQDGSIFTSVSFVSTLVTTLESRIATLEAQIAILQDYQQLNSIREQFSLTLGQGTIILNQVPILDSEMLFVNGMALAKTGVPIGLSADYTVSGNTINLTTELALQIQAGDILVVTYRYEA